MKNSDLETYCECHKIAVILKSKGRTCPACNLPRRWWFDVYKGKTDFVAMMKNTPFVMENPNPLMEPGVMHFAFGKTPEESIQNVLSEHALKTNRSGVIKLAWSCSDGAHHEHRTRIGAWICGRWQFLAKLLGIGK